MALHFEVAEFQQRIGATISMLQERGLDGLLMFRQESMYYLTGYDTFGFCFFQCLCRDNRQHRIRHQQVAPFYSGAMARIYSGVDSFSWQ